jgi:3-methylcrotonyl-CoA carboxylase beta subunit
LAILASSVDKNAAEFRANAERMRALTAELQARRAEAALGGAEKARERHVGRGKLLPRDRVMNLIDPGSPFLELSPLAANGMYDGDIHGAGLITGIGRIEGRECMIVANDATIKGGSYHPMKVKKHLRAQEIARENLASIWSTAAAPICRQGNSAVGRYCRGVCRQLCFRSYHGNHWRP